MYDNFKKNKLTFLPLLLALTITACSQPQLKPKEEIKLGAILPLSGPAAMMGTNAKNGLILAMEEINQSQKKKIRIYIEDGQADVLASLSALNKITQTEQIDKILTFMSSVSLALKPFALEKNILLFANSTHPDITDNQHPQTFRHSQTVEAEVNLLVQYVAEDLESNKIGLIALNDEYGIESVALFESISHLELSKIFIEKQENNLSSQLTKIKQNELDTIIIFNYTPSINNVLIGLKKLGYSGNIILSYNGINLIESDELKEDLYYVDYKMVDSPEYKYFADKYKLRFNQEPNIMAAVFYEDLYIINQAINKVGLDNDSIINFLQSQKILETPLNRLKMTNNNIVPELMIKKYQ